MDVVLYDQETNDEIYAICKVNMAYERRECRKKNLKLKYLNMKL